MPKLTLTVDQVTDLREDGIYFDGANVYATELDVADGPNQYRTWVIRKDALSGEKTYWRTLYRVTDSAGEPVNSLFDGPVVVFEQIPAVPTIGEGYVRFDDGAVADARRKATPSG